MRTCCINVHNSYVRTYVCKHPAYFCSLRSTVAGFSSTSPSCCSQANDTFAGDHLMESFQRLAMILANTSSGIESYQRGTFGEAFTDTLAVFETESCLPSLPSVSVIVSVDSPIFLISLIISCKVMLFLASLFSLHLFILQNCRLCPI